MNAKVMGTWFIIHGDRLNMDLRGPAKGAGLLKHERTKIQWWQIFSYITAKNLPSMSKRIFVDIRWWFSEWTCCSVVYCKHMFHMNRCNHFYNHYQPTYIHPLLINWSMNTLRWCCFKWFIRPRFSQKEELREWSNRRREGRSNELIQRSFDLWIDR